MLNARTPAPVIRMVAVAILISARLCAADTPCDPAGALYPISIQSAGSKPHGIAIADFNGDSVPDVVVANSNYPAAAGQTGTVSLHLGTGGGHFAPGTFSTVSGLPFHLDAGDFDLDGYPDLVCASYLADSVAFFRGQGGATFSPPVYYAAGRDPTFVLSADLNGDGRLDLAVLNLTSGSVSILLGQIGSGAGHGLFSSPTPYVIGDNVSYPATAAAGDFNGDGIADLAVALYGPRQIAILPGTGSGAAGDGRFGPASYVSLGTNPWNVEARDLNADGVLDLVVTQGSGMGVLIGHGTGGLGDGTFAPRVFYSAGNPTQGMASGDFTRDGIADIVLCAPDGNSLVLLPGGGSGGAGDGTFGARQTFITASHPYALDTGDLNGDGHRDLVCANYGANAFTSYLDSCATGGVPRAFEPLVGRWAPQGQPVCVAPSEQSWPAGIPDGAGGAILVWRDARSGLGGRIYAVRIDGDGHAASGWTSGGSPVCSATADERTPAVVSDGAGGAIVGWMDVRDGHDAIYVQRLTPSGQTASGWPAGALQVCSASTQASLSMDSDGLGGVIITSRDYRNNGPVAVYAYRITGAGTVAAGWPAGGLLVAGPFVISGQFLAGPNIVGDGKGGGWVGYKEYLPRCIPDHSCLQPNYRNALVRVLGSASTGLPTYTNDQDQHIGPDLQSDGGGGLLMGQGVFIDWNLSYLHSNGIGDWTRGLPRTHYTWRAATDGANGVIAAGDEVANSGIIGLRLGPGGGVMPGWIATGTPISLGPEYRHIHDVAPDGEGGGYFLWGDGRYNSTVPDLYAIRMSASGALGPGWSLNGNPVCTIRATYDASRMFSDRFGGAIVVWTDLRNGNLDIYAQRLLGDYPVPVLASFVRADAAPERVLLVWSTPDGREREFGVYRRRPQEAWRQVGVATADGSGRIDFEDHDVRSGERYGYRIALHDDSDGPFAGETWVDVPAALVFGLEGPRPNPALRDLIVAFTLPSAAPAQLELFDVGGRRLRWRDVGGLGAGRHSIRLGDVRELPPGVFVIRLTQQRESRTAKVAIVR